MPLLGSLEQQPEVLLETRGPELGTAIQMWLQQGREGFHQEPLLRPQHMEPVSEPAGPQPEGCQSLAWGPSAPAAAELCQAQQLGIQKAFKQAATAPKPPADKGSFEGNTAKVKAAARHQWEMLPSFLQQPENLPLRFLNGPGRRWILTFNKRLWSQTSLRQSQPSASLVHL